MLKFALIEPLITEASLTNFNLGNCFVKVVRLIVLLLTGIMSVDYRYVEGEPPSKQTQLLLDDSFTKVRYVYLEMQVV